MSEKPSKLLVDSKNSILKKTITPVDLEAEDSAARIVQHEVDHLNGKTIA